MKAFHNKTTDVANWQVQRIKWQVEEKGPDMVAMKGFFGQYMVAVTDWGSSNTSNVVATSSEAGEMETFQIFKSGNAVTIRTYLGTWFNYNINNNILKHSGIPFFFQVECFDDY